MNIVQDYKNYKMNLLLLIKGFFTLHTFYLVLLYRIGSFFVRFRVPFIPGITRALGIIFYSSDISPYSIIGKGFRIAHSVGIVIGGNAKIGENFECFQNVTIGGRDKEINGRIMPTIGNNVTIFAGDCVIGPVIIGDNVSIGANSVVTKDFGDNLVIAGIPARIINRVVISHSLRSMK